MTKTEYETLNEAYPTAMSVWRDRMFDLVEENDMDKGYLLDRVIEGMDYPTLGKILVGIGLDIIESRENDDGL